VVWKLAASRDRNRRNLQPRFLQDSQPSAAQAFLPVGDPEACSHCSQRSDTTREKAVGCCSALRPRKRKLWRRHDSRTQGYCILKCIATWNMKSFCISFSDLPSPSFSGWPVYDLQSGIKQPRGIHNSEVQGRIDHTGPGAKWCSSLQCTRRIIS